MLTRDAVLDTNESVSPSLLSTWGSSRLRVSAPSAERIRLQFDDTAHIDVRIPVHLRCDIRRDAKTGAAVRLVFTQRTVCVSPDTVHYGDFVRNYVNKNSSTPQRVPLRNSTEYTRVLPYLRWRCCDRNDQQPTIAINNTTTKTEVTTR